MCKECAKKVRGNFLDPEKCRNTETHFSTEFAHDASEFLFAGDVKKGLIERNVVAEEEVYSAEFVYESIYEEIPAEVSQVKVKPLLH